MPGSSCPTADWSPVTSAGADSQLAAVLAGFVFAGLVMLLSERRRGPRRVLTINLFCASFLVLAFASYLFTLVAGDTDAAACRRAWTESVVASGLLGLGAVAITSGIAWLLSSYLLSHTGEIDKEDLDDDASALAVHRLGQIVTAMLYGVIIVVAALMAVTVYGYVRSWYPKPPAWTTWALVAYTPAILLALIGWQRLRPLRDRDSNVLSDRLTGAIFLSAVTSIGYAVAGTVFTGIVAATHESQWKNPSVAWLMLTGALALILPAPSLVSLAYAVPRFPARPRPVPDGQQRILRKRRAGGRRAASADLHRSSPQKGREPS
jgi:hypothetical protein